MCSAASLNDTQFSKTKTNCCKTSLTYRVTCTAFSCAYLSKPRHECKFQKKSTCMLVISDSQSQVILRIAFGQGQSLTHAVSIVLNSRNPANTGLYLPRGMDTYRLLSLLFYAGVWCRSFVRFCPVKFSSGKLVVRVLYIDSDRALTDKQTVNNIPLQPPVYRRFVRQIRCLLQQPEANELPTDRPSVAEEM